MTASLTRDQARGILSRAAGRKVAVLGDLMLDRFVWGTVDRISPEAPVPIVRVSRESLHLGGAGNVASNLVAMGGEAWPLGVVGSGPEADALLEALALLRVDAGGVLQAPGRVTTVKTRIVAHNQQVVRFDQEQDDPLDDQTAARLARRVLEVCATADALVVSDYEKGCVTADLLSRVLPAAHARGIPIVVDPKPGLWRSYSPITAITPNQSEASRMSGMRLRGDQEAASAGEAIRKALDCRAVLLTRGELGMLLLEQGQRPLPIPATTREVYDVTGAGDTVVAAMALCLAAGASLSEAALLANAAAGVVVGKVGTATATPEEVSHSF